MCSFKQLNLNILLNYLPRFLFFVFIYDLNIPLPAICFISARTKSLGEPKMIILWKILKKAQGKVLWHYGVALFSCTDLFHFRYDDERDDLLRRLHSADAHFMNEQERQAELMRLKREQRKVEQEEKFGVAALVLGLAERSQAVLNERYCHLVNFKIAERNHH